MTKKAFSLIMIALLLSVGQLTAQVSDAQRKYTAFDMRSNGKIYVVVAVMLIIMIGLLFYVIRVDRKITRLEREVKDKHKS